MKIVFSVFSDNRVFRQFEVTNYCDIEFFFLFVILTTLLLIILIVRTIWDAASLADLMLSYQSSKVTYRRRRCLEI